MCVAEQKKKEHRGKMQATEWQVEFQINNLQLRRVAMHSIIWWVGAIVIVIAVLSFLA